MTTHSDWQTVRFSDIADNSGERVDDPSTSGASRYVGLEHVDSGELTVTRWSDPSVVTATKLRFLAGDVIFGRRRVYQRKAAVAEFDGICSAHALVLRARREYVAPEFLPAFLHSDTFVDRAVAISVGSLSPTINWKTLARQEFSLPPLSEQRKIADLIWSFERTAQAKATALEAARQAELTALAELYDEPGWPVRRVGEAGEVQLGMKREPKVHQGTDLRPYLRVANVGDDELFLDDVLEMNFAPPAFAKYALRPKDVLLNEGQSLEYVGRAAMYRGEIEDCCFQMTLLRFRAGVDVLPEFALGWFRRCQRLGAFARVAKRTTSMAHLPAGLLSAQPIPVPPLSIQQRVVERLEAARALRTTLAEDLTQTRNLMQRTLNVLLQGPGASAETTTAAALGCSA
ncbi:restriction endonuclease subunit S [Streptomyces sp. NPDC032161]|uniref:restriction endonuclease subunit S n=1 Tax=unclassified Streptomyces TaxID=2593676 RepID=UPI0033E3071A